MELSDYHDYVIVDGRLVGAWDEMYADCPDPWHQSSDAASDGRRWIVDYARQIGAGSLLEVGCGLGFFTSELSRAGFDVTGMDVSAVAVERARSLHPELADRFVVGRAQEDLGRAEGVDAVVFAEVTWYLLEDLDRVLDELRRHHAGRHLIHLLSFYGPGRQRYGRDVFTDPEGLADRVGFELLDARRTAPDADGDYASTVLFRIPE